MHNGRWGDGWGNGWWMAIMMMVALAAIAWIVVMLLRHGGRTTPRSPTVPGAFVANRPMPQEILADRLARGEIEPDEYSKRLAALLGPPRP